MPEKSKKILVFTTAYRPFIGGSEIALEQIAQRLPGIFFDILTPRAARELHDEHFSNGVVRRIGIGSRFDKYLFPLLGCFRALSLLSSGEYRIMHAYQASFGGLAAALTKTIRHDVPFVVTLQEGKDLERQPLITKKLRRWIIRRADAATVISGYLKSYVSALRSDLAISLIPNGVDIARFSEASAEQARKEFGISSSDPVILTVSRLVEKNGIDRLLSACAKLQRPYLLLIAGDGPLRKELHAFADKLGISKNVRWLGTLSYERVPLCYAVADVFVRPSRSEGLGSVFLEAMAAGVPIVAPLVGGITDLIRDGETGLACNAGDPRDIARKIAQILDDLDLATRISETAYGAVEHGYTWDLAAQRMNSVYASL